MIPVLRTHVKALSLPRLEDALLAEDWPWPHATQPQDYWRTHNVRDWAPEPWHWDTPPDPSKSRTVKGRREVKMVMPVPPQPMCPPETRITVKYEVPYGDHFSVEEKLEMIREGDGVLVTKSWSADFFKRTFLRSLIEGKVAGLRWMGDVLMVLLVGVMMLLLLVMELWSVV
eukprot:Skav200014  [mRNA]  locus=scaffold1611:20670:21692:+ [translate_table: standard]